MRFVPTKRQWKTWSLPSRLTAIGVLLTLVFGFLGVFANFVPYPDLVQLLTADAVPVPGANLIERQIARAKMEGVRHSAPSSAQLLAKFYTRPILNELDGGFSAPSVAQMAAVVTVSPFKPKNQD